MWNFVIVNADSYVYFAHKKETFNSERKNETFHRFLLLHAPFPSDFSTVLRNGMEGPP